MRNIAKTGKDGPLAHTAAAVGQCCVIALQLLSVPASLWMQLLRRHTACQTAQSRLGQLKLMASCKTQLNFTVIVVIINQQRL